MWQHYIHNITLSHVMTVYSLSCIPKKRQISRCNDGEKKSWPKKAKWLGSRKGRLTCHSEATQAVCCNTPGNSAFTFLVQKFAHITTTQPLFYTKKNQHTMSVTTSTQEIKSKSKIKKEVCWNVHNNDQQPNIRSTNPLTLTVMVCCYDVHVCSLIVRSCSFLYFWSDCVVFLSQHKEKNASSENLVSFSTILPEVSRCSVWCL